MKTAMWILSSLLALLWTGLAAVTAQVVGWAGQRLASSGTGTLGEAATAFALPSWLGPWVDTATWNAWVQAIAGAAAWLERAFPALGDAVGWLVPAVWVMWGLGLAALLALALVGHFALGRLTGSLPSLPKI